MAIELGPELRTLLEKKCYGHVVTYNRDGTAQVTMVWMDVHNGKPSFNTNTQRAKGRNLARDQRVIVSILDPDGADHAVIHGTATLIEDGAVDHINSLAKKYAGLDEYPNFQPGEVRISVDIDVDRVTGRGPWVTG